MKKLLLLLLLPLAGISQNADWVELQGKIDSAIKVHGVVLIKRNYKIDKPLVAASWNGKDYQFFTVQILGEATMWDVNIRSVITVTFKDAPALSIHKGKGVIVRGVNFRGQYQEPKMSVEELYSTPLSRYGDPTCRDSRWSPYAAVAIDPFSFELPPDGGYPSLKSWYRGVKSVSGSTGIRVEDCTLHGFTVGVVTSPNGFTLNAELLTFQNIRIGTCKIGFAGTQPQEKMNRIINVGAWGTTHTLFGFNQYGKGQPGNWIIDGVNVAGNVVQLIHRTTSGYFPLYMSNVFAESLGRIGEWSTRLSDRLDNASINFRYIDQTNGFPDFAMKGDGVTISNSTLRYYGERLPIVFAGRQKHENVNYDRNTPYFFFNHRQNEFIGKLPAGKVVVNNRKAEIKGQANVGDPVGFYDASNVWVGYGVVESKTNHTIVVSKLSPAVKSGIEYQIAVLKP